MTQQNDTWHKDTQHDETQCNDTQLNETECLALQQASMAPKIMVFQRK